MTQMLNVTVGLLFSPPQTCSDGLRCVEVRCPLVGLDSDAVMVLHAHLWNTTLTEVIQFL